MTDTTHGAKPTNAQPCELKPLQAFCLWLWLLPTSTWVASFRLRWRALHGPR